MTDIWQWYASRDEENYTSGPFCNRDDAISDGADYFSDDDGFYIIEATKPTFPAPSADRIIEDMFENACDDLFGEDYPEPCGTKERQDEAEAELQALLNGWMDKWRNDIFPTPWAFGKTRNGEYIKIPPETGTS